MWWLYRYTCYYFAPEEVRNNSISVSMSAIVCLSAHIPQKLHDQTSRKFLYMLLSSCLCPSPTTLNLQPLVPRCVLTVLWTTSCFFHNGPSTDRYKPLANYSLWLCRWRRWIALVWDKSAIADFHVTLLLLNDVNFTHRSRSHRPLRLVLRRPI